uniref:Neur_chan_LBD domain-containing protein n=1 Tax=Ascaris lumbricoides TaxID=6252 RepID=A0A0M3I846_ASCLU
MNVQLQTNSYLLWSNYHGIIGVDEWKVIKNACCQNNSDVDTCDFYGQVVWDIKTSKTTQLVDTCWSLVSLVYVQLDRNAGKKRKTSENSTLLRFREYDML